MKIWATIGPSSYDKIKELDGAGVDMFRINLSHVDELTKRIEEIHNITETPVCVDSDCNKYRDGVLNDDINSYHLTDRDLRLIDLAERMGVTNVALSFANITDVKTTRERFPRMELISKIEHLPGIRDIVEIESYSSALLIDRGDLSRSIDKQNIPDIQKHILKRFSNVFVATNLVETMMDSAEPTTGEVNDIWNTCCDGAAGLVLAGETAMGRFPVECVQEVKKVIDVFENKQRKYLEDISG